MLPFYYAITNLTSHFGKVWWILPSFSCILQTKKNTLDKHDWELLWKQDNSHNTWRIFFWKLTAKSTDIFSCTLFHDVHDCWGGGRESLAKFLKIPETGSTMQCQHLEIVWRPDVIYCCSMYIHIVDTIWINLQKSTNKLWQGFTHETCFIHIWCLHMFDIDSITLIYIYIYTTCAHIYM